MFRKLHVSDSPIPRKPKDKVLRSKTRSLDEVNPLLWRHMLDLCEGKLEWPFYLYGGVGSGKTCAALCLVDRIEKAQFWTMPDFINHFESVKQGNVQWYDVGTGDVMSTKRWWNEVASWPLLVLDDVGLRDVSNENHRETLWLALLAREEKPLICTSNHNPNALLGVYDDRVHSRICCKTVFDLRGRDRRFDPAPKTSMVNEKPK